MKRIPLTGIILAGGKSSRMGTDKGLLIYQDKPLVQYAIDLLSAFCDRIILSTGNREYLRFGLEVRSDLFPVEAAIAGIHSCLSISRTSHNIVLSCDMPYVNGHVVEVILRYAGSFDFVVPASANGNIEPLCALYHSNMLPLIEKQIQDGHYRLHDLAGISNSKIIPLEEFGGESHMYFRNLNEPKDLIQDEHPSEV